jgi:diaminohydroxyphosphoribosylaminopyrimidine deaminase/5-amino-6-(5-phosphoribosylamino)uracil reductase
MSRPEASDFDKVLMRRALAEATKGGRAVRPNPQVGAALRTMDGQIYVSHHARVGEAHAERRLLETLAAQGIDVAGGELAVTLEPCCHQGRTPPCTDIVLAARLKRVLVGLRDPNPLVAGRGLELLRGSGLDVVEDVLTDECRAINREWLRSHELGRPFVTLKMATSMDGLWSAENGQSQWITGPEARQRGHSLRARVDAIVTGKGTVESDDPSFTARASDGSLLETQPRVYVLHRGQKFDLEGRRLSKHPAGAYAVQVSDLQAFLTERFKAGDHHLLVEAGPRLSRAFLEHELVDELYLFQESLFLGGNGARLSPALAGGALPGKRFKLRHVETLGPSSLLTLLEADGALS